MSFHDRKCWNKDCHNTVEGRNFFYCSKECEKKKDNYMNIMTDKEQKERYRGVLEAMLHSYPVLQTTFNVEQWAKNTKRGIERVLDLRTENEIR